MISRHRATGTSSVVGKKALLKFCKFEVRGTTEPLLLRRERRLHRAACSYRNYRQQAIGPASRRAIRFPLQTKVVDDGKTFDSSLHSSAITYDGQQPLEVQRSQCLNCPYPVAQVSDNCSTKISSRLLDSLLRAFGGQ